MVNYGDLQFAERIMVARRSEMSAEWKVRFAICIASVAIQAFTKLLFSFSDVLKTTNCTFQEVDNIFCLAVGIAVYDEFFSCMCAAEFLCALDVFGIMSTDIYNKPTDKHQYLSPQSCHPKHCTKSIPYSQALRIKRICSNEH